MAVDLTKFRDEVLRDHYTISRIIPELLEHSANMDVTDDRGRNVLLQFIEGYTRVVAFLHHHQLGDFIYSLFIDLLAKTRDPDCRDENGNTALHLLGTMMEESLKTRRQRYDFVRMIVELLRHGADVAIHNREGKSFYTMFKNYDRQNNTEDQGVLDIKKVLPTVATLQCLSAHAVYTVRHRVRSIQHLPNFVKQYL